MSPNKLLDKLGDDDSALFEKKSAPHCARWA
jgi:hypothetical protein